MSKNCPYCDAVLTPPALVAGVIPLRVTEEEKGNFVFHTHNCPVVRRLDAEYRAWKIEIGDPYFASDPGALERRLRYLKSKKLIP